MALYVTNPEMRSWMKAQGLDPDHPDAADILAQSGFADRLGEQPGVSIPARIGTAGKAFVKELANAGRGLADLPGAVEAKLREEMSPTLTAGAIAAGDSEPTVLPRFPAMELSAGERANPISAGLGKLGGFLAQFAAPELLAAKAAGAESAIARAVSLSGLSERALMAERGATTIEEARALPAARGLLVTGGPDAMFARATREGIRMGVVAGIQPGDIDDRLAAAAQGAAFGAATGGLGAPTGAPRAIRLAREALTGAAIAPPVSLERYGIPDRATGALIGGVMSQIGGGYDRGARARTEATRSSPETRPDRLLPAPSRASGPSERVPDAASVDDLVASVLRNDTPAVARERLASLLEPERFSTLPPDVQLELRALLLNLPSDDGAGTAPPAPLQARPPAPTPSPAGMETAIAENVPLVAAGAPDVAPAAAPARSWHVLEADGVNRIAPEWRSAPDPHAAYAEAKALYYANVIEAKRAGEAVPREVWEQPGVIDAVAGERRNITTRLADEEFAAASSGSVRAHAENAVQTNEAPEKLAADITGYLPPMLATDPAAVERIGKFAYEQARQRLTSSSEGAPVSPPTLEEASLAAGPTATQEVVAGLRTPETPSEVGVALAHEAEAAPAPATRPSRGALSVRINGKTTKARVLSDLGAIKVVDANGALMAATVERAPTRDPHWNVTPITGEQVIAFQKESARAALASYVEKRLSAMGDPRLTERVIDYVHGRLEDSDGNPRVSQWASYLDALAKNPANAPFTPSFYSRLVSQGVALERFGLDVRSSAAIDAIHAIEVAARRNEGAPAETILAAARAGIADGVYDRGTRRGEPRFRRIPDSVSDEQALSYAQAISRSATVPLEALASQPSARPEVERDYVTEAIDEHFSQRRRGDELLRRAHLIDEMRVAVRGDPALLLDLRDMPRFYSKRYGSAPLDAELVESLARDHGTSTGALVAAQELRGGSVSKAEAATMRDQGKNVATVERLLVARGFEASEARAAARWVLDPRKHAASTAQPRSLAEAIETLNRRIARDAGSEAHAEEVARLRATQERLASGAPLDAAASGPWSRALIEASRPPQRAPAEPSAEPEARALRASSNALLEQLEQNRARIAETPASDQALASAPARIRRAKSGAAARLVARQERSKLRAEAASAARDQVNRDKRWALIVERTNQLDRAEGVDERVRVEEAAASAPADTASLALAREAAALIGLPGMGSRRFRALPPALQILHTALRLASYADARQRSPEKARYAVLARFFKADARRVAGYPVAHAVLEGRSSAGATSTIQRALDKLAPGVTIAHEEYGTAARPSERWLVRDAQGATASSYDTPEAAAFAIDATLRARASAPDFTPPGVNATLRLTGSGPSDALPPASDGNGAPLPARSSSVGSIRDISLIHRLFSPAQYVTGTIDAKVLALTGVDPGITRLFRAATPAYTAAGADAKRSLHDLADLARSHGVRLTRATDRRLARAARAVDDRVYSIQQAEGAAAASAALPKIAARASVEHNLSAKEHAFLFGADGVQPWLKRMYADLGIPSEEVIGYFPRANLFVRDLAGARGAYVDPLDWATSDWARTLARKRGTAADLADPSYARIVDELGLAGNSESFINTLSSYAYTGYRVKHLSAHVAEIGAAVRGVVDANGASLLGANATEFLRNMSASLMSAPSQADVLKRASKLNTRLELARSLARKASAIDRASPALKPLAGALRHIYQHLGIKALEGRENGLAETFLRFHRQSIFGLSPMRALRDSTTTALFQLYPRFETPTFVRAMAEVLNPAGHADLVKRYRDRGFLDMDDYLRFEEARIFSHVSDNFNETLSWMYRKNDTFTRMLAARLSELSVDKGARQYARNGGDDRAWGRFLQTTGIDTYKKLLTPSTSAEIRSLLNRGMTDEVATRVARLHLDGAVFNYLRPNAPQYSRTWIGRLFGQYGTWPSNMIHSLWDMYTAPVAHHGATRGALRGAAIAAKYAVAAEVVYAAGAYLGVDTSNWIPFVHNIAGYSGGPAVSTISTISDFIAGDPDQRRQFEQNPARAIGQLLRQNVPFPASDEIRRITSQLWDDTYPDDTRALFGLSAQQESAEDRLRVALGFSPYSRRVYRNRLNLAEQGVRAGVAPLQDALSDASGGMLPPGSERKARAWGRR